MQHILSLMRKAVEKYRMILNGDNIFVGLSGGKDSMLLLTALRTMQKFKDINFNLSAIHIDSGFKKQDEKEFIAVEEYVNSLDIPFYVVKTDIEEIIELRNESSPCSLCAKMRRGALNNKINDLGGGKLALGHNADDVAETFLMSLLFEGRLSCFQPTSYMSRSNITLIRPFIYIKEQTITNTVKKLQIPILSSGCKYNKQTMRQNTKELLNSILKDFPQAKERILGAIYHPERNNLWES